MAFLLHGLPLRLGIKRLVDPFVVAGDHQSRVTLFGLDHGADFGGRVRSVGGGRLKLYRIRRLGFARLCAPGLGRAAQLGIHNVIVVLAITGISRKFSESIIFISPVTNAPVLELHRRGWGLLLPLRLGWGGVVASARSRVILLRFSLSLLWGRDGLGWAGRCGGILAIRRVEVVELALRGAVGCAG